MADNVLAFIIVVTWVMGVVLAEGWLLKVAATFMPPYAWYLTVESLMKLAGLV